MDKVCGIYCIENLINSKKYIGQSVDIKSRFKKHISLLDYITSPPFTPII